MRQGSLRFPIESRNPSWTPSPPPSLDGVDEIALDCETRGLSWWKSDILVGIAIGFVRDRRTHTQYLPIRHEGGGNLPEERVREWFRREVRNKRVKNLKTSFDLHVLQSWGEDLETQGCTPGDIGHYAALLDDHRRSFSLESISQEYVGRGKLGGLEMTRMAEYHAGDVAEYAENDVALVLENLARMRPLLESQELMDVVALEDDCIYATVEMERNGAPLDGEKLERWVYESEQEYLRRLTSLQRRLGFKFDPGRRADLERLFRERDLEIESWTETGLPSFTDANLAKCKHEDVVETRFLRKLDSLRNKFILPYWREFREHGLLRYALHQLRTTRGEFEDDQAGTVSGRFSSSAIKAEDEEVGKNIQQVMSVARQIAAFGERWIIRELVVPGERDSLWFSGDAEQIEFRLFGHYAKSEKIIRAYRENPRTDFHETVRQMILAIREITRKSTKDVNFAKIYGAGLDKLAWMLGVSREEAARFAAAYDKAFPEAGDLLRRAMRVAESRGFVKTLLGRRTRFIDHRRIHKALNGIIQGSAADIMKRKLAELHRARKKTGFCMRFTVHDEVDGEVRDKRSAEMVQEILDRQSFDLRVPILWSCGTGANWRECD